MKKRKNKDNDNFILINYLGFNTIGKGVIIKDNTIKGNYLSCLLNKDSIEHISIPRKGELIITRDNGTDYQIIENFFVIYTNTNSYYLPAFEYSKFVK